MKLIIKLSIIFYFAAASLSFSQQEKPMLSITIDDPTVSDTAIMSWNQKNDAILNTLDKYGLKSALFVCGMRIDNPKGKELIEKWNSQGHMICNHSYSHKYFHSGKLSLADYKYDFLRCDSIVRGYSNFKKLYRYPYLKEGNTEEKLNGFRKFLDSMGYNNGSVTIDASDWYISARMQDTLEAIKDFDITPFKQYYLDHIYSHAAYYDSLGFAVTGRHISHTLLLHHNLINAMFLGDLIEMFTQKGWNVIDAKTAFEDNVFREKPNILPAGESLVWALAKQSGKYENTLRYPGEDGEYEEENLNNYLKNYFNNR